LSRAPSPGLCGACQHARVVTNRNGSRFVLCELSKTDPAFPRYPALPVLLCVGYEPEREGERVRG
jgi:hypothetical protein